MGLGRLFDRFWRNPPTREARNEQKKLLAAFLNAVAITLFVTGFVGPYLNPQLSTALSSTDRVLFIAGSVVLHLTARAILWTLEDR